MKKILNYKLFPIYIILLIVIFLFLHWEVYLEHATGDWFPIQSSISTPLFKPTFPPPHIEPTYFHPFRKFEYYYYNEELVLIEQAKSIFSNDLITIMGSHEAYLGEIPKDQMLRNFAVITYPNYLFFSIQCLIIILICLLSFIYIKKIIILIRF